MKQQGNRNKGTIIGGIGRGKRRGTNLGITTQPVVNRRLAFESLEQRCLLSATVTDFDITNLNSLPGSNNTIYLDFDGQTITGTLWNSGDSQSTIIRPRYALDGDTTKDYFTDEEQAAIYEIWQRVAEDYAPFNVNVTTVEPSAGQFTAGRAIRVCIGGNNVGLGSGAGVGYVDSYSWSSDTPCFVFSDDCLTVKYTAEAASHEAGHTLGIARHDGITQNGVTTDYYRGANGWAPIMGSAGSEIPLSQWSCGDYPGATCQDDDLAILEETFRVQGGYTSGYRVVAAASDFTSAITIGITAGEGQCSGVILTRDTVDYYQFTNDGSSLDFWIGGVVGITNLDTLVSIYRVDNTSEAIYTYDPQDTFYTEFTFSLSGEFYLTVEGTGKTVDGALWYSDYGSIGAYDIYIGNPDILTVNTQDDEIGGEGLSLREALILAEGHTRIEFASELAGQTILIAREFSINKMITIDATALYNTNTKQSGLTIEVDERYESRHFYLGENSIVTLIGLKLINGYLYDVEGGAISNDGGTLLLRNCQINSCSSSNYGGAIYSYQGSVTLEASIISDCTDYANGGGAVYGNRATIVIKDSTIRSCTALGAGGGISIYNGSLQIEDSTISDCSSLNHSGGGIMIHESQANLLRTTITSCMAMANGGGINHYSGTITLTDCVLSYNTASEGVTGYAGGGLYLYSGTVTVYQSQFMGNKAPQGGGVYTNNGTLEVHNSVFWGNFGSNTGGGISTYSNNAPTVTLVNVTIAGNTSVYGGGICSGSSDIIKVYNSIITANHSTYSSSYNDIYDQSTAFTESKNNLISVADAGFVCGPEFGSDGMISNASTLNLSLKNTSIACDAGDNQYVTTSVDLVGNPRIVPLPGHATATVDLGAWEVINAHPEYSICINSTLIVFENEQVIKFQLSALFSEEVKIQYWRVYWGETDADGNEYTDQWNITSDVIFVAHYYNNTTPKNFSISVEIVDSRYSGRGLSYYLGSLSISGERNRSTVSASLPEANLSADTKTEETLNPLDLATETNLDDSLVEELALGQVSSSLVAAAVLPAESGQTSRDRAVQFQNTLRKVYAEYVPEATRKSAWGDWWALSSSQSTRSPLRTDLGSNADLLCK